MDYYLKYENTGLIIATLDEDKARIVSSKILDKIIGQYDFLTEAEERENLDKILRNPNNATEVQNLVNQVRFRLWQEWQIEHPIKNGEMTVTVGEEAPSEKLTGRDLLPTLRTSLLGWSRRTIKFLTIYHAQEFWLIWANRMTHECSLMRLVPEFPKLIMLKVRL